MRMHMYTSIAIDRDRYINISSYIRAHAGARALRPPSLRSRERASVFDLGNADNAIAVQSYVLQLYLARY